MELLPPSAAGRERRAGHKTTGAVDVSTKSKQPTNNRSVSTTCLFAIRTNTRQALARLSTTATATNCHNFILTHAQHVHVPVDVCRAVHQHALSRCAITPSPVFTWWCSSTQHDTARHTAHRTVHNSRIHDDGVSHNSSLQTAAKQTPPSDTHGRSVLHYNPCHARPPL